VNLVAEDRDRGLWAVQAKAYASFYAIKKSGVDPFLRQRWSSAPKLQPRSSRSGC